MSLTIMSFNSSIITRKKQLGFHLLRKLRHSSITALAVFSLLSLRSRFHPLLPTSYNSPGTCRRKMLHFCLLTISLIACPKYQGYPSGSMVEFACDAYGSPIIAVSNLALHTKDLLENPRCSLLVAKDPEDRTDLVITVMGDALRVPESNAEAIRTAYMTKHPDAFWVDFGDFQFLRIEPKVVRYVSDIATALFRSGEFSGEEFQTAEVDPIYQFSKPITSHMNKDHSEDTKLIVQHYSSVPVEYAYMLDVDSLGFSVKAGCEGNTFKLRVPFTRRAAERKDVKTLIIEMLKTAKTQAE